MTSNHLPTWQKSLQPQLLRRLTRPLVQPGIVNTQMARRIIERSQSMLDRLPLLAQQMQRHSAIAELQSEYVPIVYAQPLTTAVPDKGEPSPAGNTKSSSQKTVVQAKFVSPGDSSNHSHSQTISTDTSGRFSSAEIDVSDATTKSVVSPKPLGTDLVSPPQMPWSETEAPSSGTGGARDSSLGDRGEVSPPQVQAKADSSSPRDNFESQRVEGFLSAKSNVTDATNQPVVSPKPLGANLVTPPQMPLSRDLPNYHIVQGKLSSPYSKSQIPTPRSHELPVVRVSTVVENRSEPLIFSSRAIAKQEKKVTPPKPPASLSNYEGMPLKPPENSHPQWVERITQTSVSKANPPPKIDLNALVDKVERKLMRRLAIESERRGKKRWR